MRTTNRVELLSLGYLVLGFLLLLSRPRSWAGEGQKGLADRGGPTADQIRWSFDLESSDGRFDARERVPLAQAEVGWKQLFGKDADPKAPDLYPRTPEALLLSYPQKGPGRRLELRTHGARALVVSSPKLLPPLVHYTLRATVDCTLLGRGSLRISILFFGAEPESLLDRESVEASASDGPRSVRLSGEVPRDAAKASLEILLAGEAEEAVSSALADDLELALLPGIRVELGPGCRPFFDEEENIEISVLAYGLSRGQHVLTYSLSQSWLTPRIGAPFSFPVGEGDSASEALKPLEEKSRAGWAASGRPLRWVLFPRDSISPRSPQGASELKGSLSPGSYKLSLRVEDEGKSVCLERSCSFPVLPLSTRTPRHFWRVLEGELKSPTSPSWVRYLGAFRAEGDPLESHPLAVHVFFSPQGGALLFSEGILLPPDLRERLGLSGLQDLLSRSQPWRRTRAGKGLTSPIPPEGDRLPAQP